MDVWFPHFGTSVFLRLHPHRRPVNGEDAEEPLLVALNVRV